MIKTDLNVLLESISTISAVQSQIIANEKKIQCYAETLEIVAQYFKVSHREAFMFSLVFTSSFGDKKFSFANYAEFSSNSVTNIIIYREELETLCTKGILKKVNSYYGDSLLDVKYFVDSVIILNILDKKPFSKQKKKEPDIYSLLMKIYNIIEKMGEYNSSTKFICKEASELLLANKHMPVVKAILELKLKPDHNLIYIYILWNALDCNQETNASCLLNIIYTDAGSKIRVMQSLINGSNQLIKQDLIEACESLFSKDMELKLTQTSISLFKQFGISLAKAKKQFETLIKPGAILPKDLIFRDTEIKQLASLKELLKKDSLENITQALKKLNKASGVTALFYGGSGTGKTETVLQMARESGREIMKVDISQAKSMWYGQSEKIVKKIFTEYTSFRKESDRVPILFINEADALISKRTNLSISQASNTENTVQNILLEELENFDGILIATTNLIQNFDSAFDRRFLFKIHFPEPDCEIRAKIWQSKIPTLNTQESLQLASQFKLSGGNIENIATKLIIEEAIYGHSLPFEKITELCSNELLNRKTQAQPIGFKQWNTKIL